MTRTVYFPANNLNIEIEKQPNGEWTAVSKEWEPGMPQGWGRSEMSAIADLAEQMVERGELESAEA